MRSAPGEQSRSSGRIGQALHAYVRESWAHHDARIIDGRTQDVPRELARLAVWSREE
jgi:hypothetical protein